MCLWHQPCGRRSNLFLARSAIVGGRSAGHRSTNEEMIVVGLGWQELLILLVLLVLAVLGFGLVL